MERSSRTLITARGMIVFIVQNIFVLMEKGKTMSRLIDEDVLIEFIENRYDITWKDDYEGGIKDACTDILEKISKMPTIEPERKKGKWLPENRTIDAFWVCSSCGFPSEAHAANILYNFCPHCGADMREDQHDQSK